MKLADYIINALAALTFNQTLLIIDLTIVVFGISAMFIIILWPVK